MHSKHGTNEKKCKKYSGEKRREKNKLRKLKKHCSNQTNDLVAAKALNKLVKTK
jgi:hypothetical protein